MARSRGERGEWEHFLGWAEEHSLDFRAPDVQDVYYTWIEIFSSKASLSEPESLEAFHAYLILSGYEDEEAWDIVEQYATD